MSLKLLLGAALLLGSATTVGVGLLSGEPQERPAEAKAKPAGAGDGPTTARPNPGLERLRALPPALRLKAFESLVATDTAFTAATKGDLAAAVVERGSLEPAAYSDLVCEVKAKGREGAPATTIKSLVEEGTSVKPGDQVVVLDDAAARDHLEVATVAARQAEAALVHAREDGDLARREGEIDVRLAEIDVKLAETELKAAPTGATKEVLELKAEQAKLKLDRATARVRAHRTRADADVRARAVATDLAVRRLRDAELELKKCVLLAPAAGVVVYPSSQSGRPGAPTIAPGEPVREGQILVRVADVSRLVLVAAVHESAISTVRPGQPVRVLIDAIPGKPLSGTVTRVSPVPSASRWLAADVKVYPVTIAVEDVPRSLKPGMTGEALIETGERKGVLRVPRTAVVDDGKSRVCFVKVGHELIERPVVLGAGNATTVEVRDGLTEGDLVVTDPRAVPGRP